MYSELQAGRRVPGKEQEVKPTFKQKALAFVIISIGTVCSIFLTTHLVKAGIGFLGKCS